MTTTDGGGQLSPNAAFSQAVLRLKDERGLTVDQLAVFSGLNRASVYRKLKGEAGWKLTDIAALAEFFHVQPGDMLAGGYSIPRPRGNRRSAPATVNGGPGGVERHRDLALV